MRLRVRLFASVHAYFCVFAHDLNQYTQEGGIKATNQLQAAEAAKGLVHQMFCQLPNPFNQCNKQLFQHLSLSLPQDAIPLFCRRTGDHQSAASPRCLSFIIPLFFFSLPMRAFKPDPCALAEDRCGKQRASTNHRSVRVALGM